MERIYLDNNATTPLDPIVGEAMLEALQMPVGNPSSVHWFGKGARKVLEAARGRVAHFFQVKPSEVIFTSGGTESIAMLLRGFLALHPKSHIVSSNVEHSAVYQTLERLKSKEAKITYLPVGLWGAVQPEQIEKAAQEGADLFIFASVNNETGVKIDLPAIAAIAHKAGIPLIIDAVSHVGKELFHLPPGVVGLTFSAHKFHGPQGVGGLILRPPLKISPIFIGGSQEFGKRAGTENLPGIIGLAKALDQVTSSLPAATVKMLELQKRLLDHLFALTGNVVVHGQTERICNTASIGFPDLDGEALLIGLDNAGVAVSLGSACSSGALEPSRVLLNMGIPPQLARSSLRFSLSRMTTASEIDRACEALGLLIRRRR
jgi:cysteine desulfurase